MTSKARTIRRDIVQGELEKELERLKELLGLDLGLRVLWKPDDNKQMLGEVKNGLVYIYVDRETEAKEILRHEVIDFLVSQAVEPYKEVSNSLIRMVNDTAYKVKERVVEALTRLIDKRQGETLR